MERVVIGSSGSWHFIKFKRGIGTFLKYIRFENIKMAKEVTANNTLHASAASPDGIAIFFQTCKEELEKSGFSIDDKVDLVFGLKQWPLARGSHRAVIIKIKNVEKVAFRLELEIDLEDEEKEYIAGSFECPGLSCDFVTNSFAALACHHLQNHRLPQGDDIKHQCCNQEFEVFESFCAHVYETHRNFKAVTLNFEKILEEKYEKFLDPKSVKFFPQHFKKLSFRCLVELAADIILNFGRYFIFFWNCQDFATWFLKLVGIPLDVIDPTIPDKLTGSGKDSKARAIQGLKDWAWYKQPIQIQHFKLTTWNGEARCNHTGCEVLPPFFFQTLKYHLEAAHLS
ncbi:uncharacterized protein LOC106460228 isoform X2 [Limulus polyphemus]|nr:uncharacterized protein LOC106460228 isoform X2 [Limulus polyphemus]